MTSFQKARRISYIYESQTWEETEIEVSIESEPFAKGAMRNAYKMLIKSSQGEPSRWVIFCFIIYSTKFMSLLYFLLLFCNF